MFITKTHDNYSSYLSIMIIYRETHENITLFHYSGCYHIYLKPMVNIILKNNIGGHYLKSPKENIIYKVIHSKNYEKLYSYCLKPMEINTQNLL